MSRPHDASYLRVKAATIARMKLRYHTDAEYRARIKAEALAWYYRNRGRVLERLRVKRREGSHMRVN